MVLLGLDIDLFTLCKQQVKLKVVRNSKTLGVVRKHIYIKQSEKFDI